MVCLVLRTFLQIDIYYLSYLIILPLSLSNLYSFQFLKKLRYCEFYVLHCNIQTVLYCASLKVEKRIFKQNLN